MVGVSEELKILDLREIARNCPYPSLLICGSKDMILIEHSCKNSSKDKPNLSSMKDIQ